MNCSMSYVDLTLRFCASGDGIHATLTLAGQRELEVNLAILHEGLREATVSDITGDLATEYIEVQDSESLTIIARAGGAIVATGVFEVDLAQVEATGLLLIPRCTSNLLVEQIEIGHPSELHQISEQRVDEEAADVLA